jgi:ABC-type lipoprotein release transport system permease subunit
VFDRRTLTRRSLAWYRRTHAAVFLGVATAIAVLTGALLVGDSVRGSLRGLVLLRLGETDQIVLSTGFFTEELAASIRSHPDFAPLFDDVVPIVIGDGFVRTQVGDGQAGPVRVYGVDSRFWQFHRIPDLAGPEGRQAYLSPALAAALDLEAGDTILVRVPRPTDMPPESVYGEKDDVGQTVRATVAEVLPRERLGEFSLDPTQGDVQAVFLSLDLLQEELDRPGEASALLVSGGDPLPEDARGILEDIVRQSASLGDLGLRLRRGPDPEVWILESRDGLLGDAVAEAALEAGADAGFAPAPIFTYLANSIRHGESEIPYSLVAALDLAAFAPEIAIPPGSALPPIVLADLALEDLGAAGAEIGDTVTLDYYLWEEPGYLATGTADFFLAGSVSVLRGDPALAPDYPGISDSLDLADWDPPFPVDLGRLRPADERYWDLYRTTPRAYIPLEAGQDLWRSRYGALTSVRFTATGEGATLTAELLATEIRNRIDPLQAGLAVAEVRARGLEASRGAVNFSEYFVYFSFFLVASALLLAALFFKLSVEQRAREVGLLRAVGFPPSRVARLFLGEGLWLAIGGGVAGLLGGIAYAWLIVFALGTWWVGAVGTTHLTLHVSALSLLAGAGGGIVAALLCIWATLGSMGRVSERRLLAGQPAPARAGGGGKGPFAAGVGGLLGAGALVGGTLLGAIPDAAGFFGAGTALLGGCLAFFIYASSRTAPGGLDGTRRWPVTRLGLRNVTWRPARSVVAVAMIASATFILISVDAFRTDAIDDVGPDTGIGGYNLIVETLLPVVHDPGSREGREALGLDLFEGARVEGFRYRPGEDASCLNLYAPGNPRIIAPSDRFIDDGRFRFAGALATTAAERENPWLLLATEFPDGAIPVIADTHSITYVLNRRLGEDIVIEEGGREIRLRLVASLEDSIFQGELLMSEARFRETFPNQAGYAYWLVETGPAETAEVEAAIGEALEDHGARITGTAQRLARFHEVENTYLSTFQALGALGLLLGTVGLGAVLLRNILERRRELALLRALGYERSDFITMMLAENALLLAAGLGTGAVSALVAIAPAVLERGGRLPGSLLVLLIGGVLVLGLLTSLGATLFALRSPLLAALRSE